MTGTNGVENPKTIHHPGHKLLLHRCDIVHISGFDHPHLKICITRRFRLQGVRWSTRHATCHCAINGTESYRIFVKGRFGAWFLLLRTTLLLELFFSNIFCSRYDFVLSIALMYLIILWVCGWTANKATTSTSFCIVASKVSHEEPQSSFSVNLHILVPTPYAPDIKITSYYICTSAII